MTELTNDDKERVLEGLRWLRDQHDQAAQQERQAGQDGDEQAVRRMRDTRHLLRRALVAVAALHGLNVRDLM